MRVNRTSCYDDFIDYYQRASLLNRRNARLLPAETTSGDQLQDVIPIYDTVWRRWAGFSRVLEAVWKGCEEYHTGKQLCPVAYRQVLSLEAWLYVCLVHRITGSGASFERDHGCRNTVIFPMMVDSRFDPDHNDSKFTVDWMADFVLRKARSKMPIFTSIGNQIPPFNKPVPPYERGGEMYLHRDAPKLAKDLAKLLTENAAAGKKTSIKPMTDWILDWHAEHGMKRYKFVLTAYAMDIAEYYPDLVDQQSHVYLGKNAVSAMNILFDKVPGIKQLEHEEAIMEALLLDTKDDPAGYNNPYSMEDVMCDFIRYVHNYIPKQYAKEGLRPCRLPLRYDDRR